MTEEQKNEFVTGFALNLEEVKKMKDRKFTILEAHNVPDKFNPGQMKVKLTIQLSNNDVVDYYPNKTQAQAIVVRQRGRNLANWVGYRGVLGTKLIPYGNSEKEVICIERNGGAA